MLLRRTHSVPSARSTRSGTLLAAFGCLFCRTAGADPSAACPDGWFCEPPPEVTPAAPEAPLPTPAPPPEPGEPPLDYAPGVSFPDVEDDYEPEPTRGDRAFGVTARALVPLIDAGDSQTHPFMAGPGVGLLYLPLDFIGVEFSVDSAFGRDALDAKRRELAISAALLAFFESHELVQVFLSTGLFHSWADVEPRQSYDRHYRYFGAFLGLGTELTFHPLYSVFLRLDGFIRGRVDQGAGSDPEFFHQTTGETSNSSAGMLLRVGAARYF